MTSCKCGHPERGICASKQGKRYSMNIRGDIGGYINHADIEDIQQYHKITKEELEKIDALAVGDNLVLFDNDLGGIGGYIPTEVFATVYRMS